MVVAKIGLAPGTLLTADLLEVRSIPDGGVPSDAFKDIKDVEGQMLTVGRAPGDLITQSVVGESAARKAPDVRAPNSIYSALLAAEDGSYGAMVMDMAPDETEWMTHPLLFANAVLLVYRPIMADLFALRHTLNILTRLGTHPREPLLRAGGRSSNGMSLSMLCRFAIIFCWYNLSHVF